MCATGEGWTPATRGSGVPGSCTDKGKIMKKFRMVFVLVMLLEALTVTHAQTTAERVQKARDTAISTTNACGQIHDTGFYWELGDVNGMFPNAGGTVVGTSGAPGRGDLMSIASASKWIYAAYVAQRFGASTLTPRDFEFLTMSSGYHSQDTQCTPADTVSSCLQRCSTHQADQACHAATPPNFYSCNGAFSNDAGQFYYDGGHFEAHASSWSPFTNVFHGTNLGSDNKDALQSELETYLPGAQPWIEFTVPVLAESVKTTPGAYIDDFLVRILANSLQISSLLGKNAVCTDVYHLDGSGRRICPSALYEPPGLCQSGDIWHYSVGHWIEDDPSNGDGSFSSAGARGFYPWIWKWRQGDDYGGWTDSLYGVVARDVTTVSPSAPLSTDGWKSVACGQAIRTAFLENIAQ